MGRISKGILGGFSGKVGTVVGSRWKGIDYIRSKSTARKSSASPKQEAQRAKFKLVTSFLSTMIGLIRVSFRDFEVNMSGRNHALAYNIENAVKGEGATLDLEYSMVLVSRGNKLPNAANPTAAAGTPGNIAFNWENNAGTGDALPGDQAILVAFCPSLKQSVFTTAGPARSTGSGILNVAAFAGREVHTWISFLSENGKHVATSVYTGAVTVA